VRGWGGGVGGAAAMKEGGGWGGVTVAFVLERHAAQRLVTHLAVEQVHVSARIVTKMQRGKSGANCYKNTAGESGAAYWSVGLSNVISAPSLKRMTRGPLCSTLNLR